MVVEKRGISKAVGGVPLNVKPPGNFLEHRNFGTPNIVPNKDCAQINYFYVTPLHTTTRD